MAIYELQSPHRMRDLWGMISPYIESKIAWQCQADRQCITMYCIYKILAPYIAMYPFDCNVLECIAALPMYRNVLRYILAEDHGSPLDYPSSLRITQRGIATIYYELVLLGNLIYVQLEDGGKE